MIAAIKATTKNTVMLIRSIAVQPNPFLVNNRAPVSKCP